MGGGQWVLGVMLLDEKISEDVIYTLCVILHVQRDIRVPFR